MFITTTLGGLVIVISVGMAVGSIAGALVRPPLDRAHVRFMEAADRVMRRSRHDVMLDVHAAHGNSSAGP